jgi:hypothetical protein
MFSRFQQRLIKKLFYIVDDVGNSNFYFNEVKTCLRMLYKHLYLSTVMNISTMSKNKQTNKQTKKLPGL